MKRIGASSWDVASEHFAERFQLFVIIALGESIVITGATTSAFETLETNVVAAFIVAFLGSAALWWLYFNRAADRMAGHLEDALNRTELARDIYTYLHVLVIAGIIVTAVGDELVIAHPSESLETNELVALVAGPVIYLLALSATRYRSIGSISPKRTVAAVLCVLIGFAFSGLAGAADRLAAHRRPGRADHRRGDGTRRLPPTGQGAGVGGRVALTGVHGDPPIRLLGSGG